MCQNMYFLVSVGPCFILVSIFFFCLLLILPLSYLYLNPTKVYSWPFLYSSMYSNNFNVIALQITPNTMSLALASLLYSRPKFPLDNYLLIDVLLLY